MNKCEKCDKIFKTNWHLQRHLSKKRNCGRTETHLSNMPNNLSNMPNTERTNVLIHPDVIYGMKSREGHKPKCEFCMKEFSSKQALTKHYTSCKEKYDDIRCLEIKLGVFVDNISAHECRFCKYKSNRTTHVTNHKKTCKARIRYKQEIERMTTEQQLPMSGSKTVVNGDSSIVNNNIQNNINIMVNPVGKENYSYITSKKIKMLSKKIATDVELFAKTLTYIHAHPKHPENLTNYGFREMETQFRIQVT